MNDIQKSILNALRLRRKACDLIMNSPWVTAIINEKIEDKPGRGSPRTPFLKQIMG